MTSRGAGAVGQARAELAVERGQPARERLRRWRRSRRGAPGRRRPAGRPTACGDGGVAHRVEPEVRVGRAGPRAVRVVRRPRSAVKVRSSLAAAATSRTRSGGLVRDGLVDGRLEALRRRRRASPWSTPPTSCGRELEVVRLGAGLGEDGDAGRGRRRSARPRTGAGRRTPTTCTRAGVRRPASDAQRSRRARTDARRPGRAARRCARSAGAEAS